MEWLHPWALWFSATLAFPLWLHLRQRSKPRTVEYPSLLLLKQGFPQAMQQQRLRDLLQLILRLLILLCLVLALAQPRWKTIASWPDKATLICDNSVTGLLPHPQHGTALKSQLAEAAEMDRKLGARFRRLPVLQETGLGLAEERFGDPTQVLGRWLSDSDSHEEPEVIILSDVLMARSPGAQKSLKEWLGKDRARRVLVWESGRSAIPQIQNVSWERDSAYAIRLSITPAKEPSLPYEGVVQWKSGLEKKIQPRDGQWKLSFEKSLESEGGFRMDVESSQPGPWNRFYFCWPRTKEGRILHLGSSWVSIPSLGFASNLPSGPGSNQAAIEHWPPGSDLPQPTLGGDRPTLAIMVSGEPLSSESLERLATFVLEGGGLMISLGARSDIAALNSRLLSPLGMGRIGNLHAPSTPQAVHPLPQGYRELQILGATLETSAKVSKYFVQEDIGQAQALWKTGNHALAIFRRVGAGRVLLWNADIDSLSWTDVGLDPLFPITQRAFLAQLKSKHKPVEVATDSIWTWTTTEEKPRVVDPNGRDFTRIRRNLAGIQVGPFPKAGIYTCYGSADTVRLAVNLAQPWNTIPIPWMDPGSSAREWDWKPVQDQVVFTKEKPSLAMAQSQSESWPIWVSMALMLLLLDGLAALLLRPRKPHLAGS